MIDFIDFLGKCLFWFGMGAIGLVAVGCMLAIGFIVYFGIYYYKESKDDKQKK